MQWNFIPVRAGRFSSARLCDRLSFYTDRNRMFASPVKLTKDLRAHARELAQTVPHETLNDLFHTLGRLTFWRSLRHTAHTARWSRATLTRCGSATPQTKRARPAPRFMPRPAPCAPAPRVTYRPAPCAPPSASCPTPRRGPRPTRPSARSPARTLSVFAGGVLRPPPAPLAHLPHSARTARIRAVCLRAYVRAGAAVHAAAARPAQRHAGRAAAGALPRRDRTADRERAVGPLCQRLPARGLVPGLTKVGLAA